MKTTRVLLIGATTGVVVAATLSPEPPATTEPAEMHPPSRPVLPARQATAAPAILIEEEPELTDEGNPFEPPVSIDALLDELEADSAPGLAEIDREAFKAELLADPALRDYFSRAR